MTATRFETMRDLFDEFPSLKHSVKLKPGDEEPVAEVHRLTAAGRLREASALCAFLLRRREAVWWACQCLRLRPGLIEADDQPPQTWAAHAAGYSSGTIGAGVDGPVRVPPHLTAESARCAILLAETRLEQKDAPAFLKQCIDAALALLTAQPNGR